MDKRDLASQAERYKQEMMRLYGRSTARPEEPSVSVRKNEEDMEKKPEITVIPEADIRDNPEFPQPAEMVPVTEEEEAVPMDEMVTHEEMPAPAEEMPVTEEAPPADSAEDISPGIDERYPEPDLSELTGNNEENRENNIRQPYSEEGMGTATGFIVVNVRTGDDSEPVPGAVVTITAIHEGNSLLFGSGETNISGATDKFSVPVPDIEYSLAPGNGVRPYGLFDISVTADGFFNARSVDVPVFDGITSVQNFSMIPLPLFMKASDETITYYNQEPNM